MTSDKMAAELVEHIAQECFHGVLPPFPSVIVAAVVQCVPCVRDAGPEETQRFADELMLAINRYLNAQRAAEQQAEFPNWGGSINGQ